MESDMFAVTYGGESGITVTWRVGTPSLSGQRRRGVWDKRGKCVFGGKKRGVSPIDQPLTPAYFFQRSKVVRKNINIMIVP